MAATQRESEFGALTVLAVRETETADYDDPDYERPMLRPVGFYQVASPNPEPLEE